jgi:hypothetical protein
MANAESPPMEETLFATTHGMQITMPSIHGT